MSLFIGIMTNRSIYRNNKYRSNVKNVHNCTFFKNNYENLFSIKQNKTNKQLFMIQNTKKKKAKNEAINKDCRKTKITKTKMKQQKIK